MENLRIGRLVRTVRHRRRWRQVDLANRAGTSRTIVARVELGLLDSMPLGTIRRALAPLGISIDIGLRGPCADLDRVIDEVHAALLGICAAWLNGLGWQTILEVSFSEWGERGSIDLLAWHEATATLLVVEIKTELVTVEGTLRTLDAKVRLAPAIVAQRFGWRPAHVARLLVLPDERTERRRVARHGVVLQDAFPDRGYAVRRWCASPAGPLAGLLFMSSAGRRHGPLHGRQERIRRATGA
ncbi:MAG: helix-turn-helix domain-containing protein [Candidatus Limnocylindrales bacterium]